MKLKCPCGERLVAPESAAGKRGKCAKCGRRFIIPSPKPASAPTAKSAAPDAAPSTTSDIGLGEDLPELGDALSDLGGDLSDLLDEALDEPHPAAAMPTEPTPAPEPTAATETKSRGKRQTLKGLSLGIKMVLGGTVLSMLAVLVGLAALFVGEGLALVSDGATLLGGGLVTVGRFVCLAAPKQIKGKGFLIAAIVCDLGYLALAFAGEALMSPLAATITTNVLPLFTFILFILFLREVGESLDQRALVEAGSEVIYAVLLAGLCLLGLMAPIAGLYCALGFVFFLLAAVWKYVTLLTFAAECVDYAGGRR